MRISRPGKQGGTVNPAAMNSCQTGWPSAVPGAGRGFSRSTATASRPHRGDRLSRGSAESQCQGPFPLAAPPPRKQPRLAARLSLSPRSHTARRLTRQLLSPALRSPAIATWVPRRRLKCGSALHMCATGTAAGRACHPNRHPCSAQGRLQTASTTNVGYPSPAASRVARQCLSIWRGESMEEGVVKPNIQKQTGRESG